MLYCTYRMNIGRQERRRVRDWDLELRKSALGSISRLEEKEEHEREGKRRRGEEKEREKRGRINWCMIERVRE